MALTQFADSPRNGAWGDRPYTLVEVAGPASYTQVVNGVAPAAPTGGQALTGISLQLGPGTTPEGIIPVGGSTSGTYVPMWCRRSRPARTLRARVIRRGRCAGSSRLPALK